MRKIASACGLVVVLAAASPASAKPSGNTTSLAENAADDKLGKFLNVRGKVNRDKLADKATDWVEDKGLDMIKEKITGDDAGPFLQTAVSTAVDSAWEGPIKSYVEGKIKGTSPDSLLKKETLSSIRGALPDSLTTNIASKAVDSLADKLGLDESSFKQKRGEYTEFLKKKLAERAGVAPEQLDWLKAKVDKKIDGYYKKIVEGSKAKLKEKVLDPIRDKIMQKATAFLEQRAKAAAANAAAKVQPPPAETPKPPAPQASAKPPEPPKPEPAKPEPAKPEPPKQAAAPSFKWSYADKVVQVGLLQADPVHLDGDTSKIWLLGDGEVVLKPKGSAPVVLKGCKFAALRDKTSTGYDDKSLVEIRYVGTCSGMPFSLGYFGGRLDSFKRIEVKKDEKTYIWDLYLSAINISMPGTIITSEPTSKLNLLLPADACPNTNYASPANYKGGKTTWSGPTVTLGDPYFEIRSNTWRWTRSADCKTFTPQFAANQAP